MGAAESIVEFLELDVPALPNGNTKLDANQAVTIQAEHLEVFSPDGTKLVGPVSFTLDANQATALVGPSGAGKTSLINAILAFCLTKVH